MALVLDVSVEANLFEVIKISATGKLELNFASDSEPAGVTMPQQLRAGVGRQ
jgi:hypothetical protein